MWQLELHRDAIRELYQAGQPIAQVLQQLRTEPQPWADDLAIGNRPGRYERYTAGHWIGYEVNEERGVIRILYIQPNN